MDKQNLESEVLNKKEKYMISVAILELGGPYHKVSRFYNHLLSLHQAEFDDISEKIDKEMGVPIEKIPLVLDALYLLNETGDTDFEVICRNDIKNSSIGTITRVDVKGLCDKLEKIYSEQKIK